MEWRRGSRDFPYDTRRSPPAPVLPLRVGRPRGEPVVAVAAVVDSGADITVVPEGLAGVLGLPPVGEVTVRGVAGAVRVPVYAAEVEAVGTRRIVEAVALGADMLLGRDVLNRWRVTLDGPARVLRVVPEGRRRSRAPDSGPG